VHFASQRRQPTAEHDHERDRQLRHRLRIDAGRVPNRHAVTSRCREIDHVEADAVLAHQLQVRQRRED
jgi:hypothetical protein